MVKSNKSNKRILHDRAIQGMIFAEIAFVNVVTFGMAAVDLDGAKIPIDLQHPIFEEQIMAIHKDKIELGKHKYPQEFQLLLS